MDAFSGVTQPLVHAVIVVNQEGARITSRYCDRAVWRDLMSQRAFEKRLLGKVQALQNVSESVEVMEIEDFVVAFKQSEDLFLFVVAPAYENELVMAQVLDSLYDTLHLLLRGQVFEEAVLDNLESLLLTVDELVDQEGIIMEVDPQELVERVGLRNDGLMEKVQVGEQTLGQALQTARDQLTRSILS